MNANTEELKFKIGIIGPTRVGKTTLLTSILENAHELLAGSQVVFESANDKTKQIVSDSNNALNGSLIAGEFDVAALGGTQSLSELDFVLSHSNCNDVQVQISFLDFPGGWLDKEPQNKSEWEYCLKWIRDSQILLVPIDASVIMEASNPNHLKAIPNILSLNNVTDVVRRWAKVRSDDEDFVSGTLLFCPLKCESYFSDNGGKDDKSEELINRIRKFYREIKSVAHSECQKLSIVYSPIDSIGCVEISDGKWTKIQGNNGSFKFEPTFRVRGSSPSRSVKGADSILINVFKNILTTTEKIKENDYNKTYVELSKMIQLRDQDEGIILNFINWLTGEKKDRIDNVKKGREDFRKKKIARDSLNDIIKKVKERKPSRQSLDF